MSNLKRVNENSYASLLAQSIKFSKAVNRLSDSDFIMREAESVTNRTFQSCRLFKLNNSQVLILEIHSGEKRDGDHQQLIIQICNIDSLDTPVIRSSSDVYDRDAQFDTITNAIIRGHILMIIGVVTCFFYQVQDDENTLAFLKSVKIQYNSVILKNQCHKQKHHLNLFTLFNRDYQQITMFMIKSQQVSAHTQVINFEQEILSITKLKAAKNLYIFTLRTLKSDQMVAKMVYSHSKMKIRVIKRFQSPFQIWRTYSLSDGTIVNEARQLIKFLAFIHNPKKQNFKILPYYNQSQLKFNGALFDKKTLPLIFQDDFKYLININNSEFFGAKNELCIMDDLIVFRCENHKDETKFPLKPIDENRLCYFIEDEEEERVNQKVRVCEAILNI